MRVSIRPPAGNTRGPIHVESLLRTFHRAARRNQIIRLGIEANSGSIDLTADIPDGMRTLFLQELQDAYPGTVIAALRRETSSPTQRTWTQQLRLRPDVLMMTTYDQFLDVTENRKFADPLAGIIAAIRTGRSGKFASSVEFVIRPAVKNRAVGAERIERRLKSGFASRRMHRCYLLAVTHERIVVRMVGMLLAAFSRKQLSTSDEHEQKSTSPLFECWLTIQIQGPGNAADVAERRLREITGAFGRYHSDETSFVVGGVKRSNRRGFLLTPKEIASLWHPLTESGDSVAQVERPSFREIEPPVDIASKKGSGAGVLLGRVKFRNLRSEVRIATDDLRRHLIAVGKTGCGKSTFLLNVVRQQIEANQGVILIDPHGQLADDVLNVVPSRRTNDVIVFDASDRVAPVGFNPMIGPPGTDSSLVADGVLTSFKHVFGLEAGSAPRLLHIFRNCLLTLIGTPHATLANVQRLLVDAPFRKSMAAAVENLAVRDFWLTEFGRWNERDRTQYIASLQNKLGAFLTNEQLQRILGSNKKGLHIRQAMDASKVVICDLSKGMVGHDASTLLGSLLLSSIQMAAMSRANIAENERTDCLVVVDEFHSYLAEGNTTMADALAESRKYRTSYLLSTQLLEQLDPQTLAGVLGNCGSVLTMTVGPRDATVLAELLANGLEPNELMKIPKYHGYLRLLVDGAPHTLSMITLPPKRSDVHRSQVVRQYSRQRYG